MTNESWQIFLDFIMKKHLRGPFFHFPRWLNFWILSQTTNLCAWLRYWATYYSSSCPLTVYYVSRQKQVSFRITFIVMFWKPNQFLSTHFLCWIFEKIVRTTYVYLEKLVTFTKMMYLARVTIFYENRIYLVLYLWLLWISIMMLE